MELNAKKVKFIMAAEGLTFRALAEKAGIGKATLSLWLNHGKQPRLDKIGSLAKALGVPLTSIIMDED